MARTGTTSQGTVRQRAFCVGGVAGFALGVLIAMWMLGPVTPGEGACTAAELRKAVDAALQRQAQAATTKASDRVPAATPNRADPSDLRNTWPSGTPGPMIVLPASVSMLLSMLHFTADRAYEMLINAPSQKRGLVVEVGAFDGQQAAFAYHRGHQVLVLEPSPINTPKVKAKLRNAINDPTGRLTLLQVAASNQVGTAEFFTNINGSPGDHISLNGKVHEGEEQNYLPHRSYKTTVKTMPLDDIVGTRRVYFLKVDVQGHELFVFEGCQRMLRERRVAYALFEFQPKQLGAEAYKMIEELNEYGYDTFALMPWWSRGEGFSDEWYSFPTNPRLFQQQFRPEHANGMGEWTDILAVCRTCVAENHADQDKFMQPFDAAEIEAIEKSAKLAEKGQEPAPPIRPVGRKRVDIHDDDGPRQLRAGAAEPQGLPREGPAVAKELPRGQPPAPSTEMNVEQLTTPPPTTPQPLPPPPSVYRRQPPA
jgi:FkbM family methyltransferase